MERNNNEEGGEDLASLEYEEDCYFAFAEKSETPSFDIDDATWAEEDNCIFVLVDEDYGEPSMDDLTDNFHVETEFYNKKTKNNKFIRAVRVRFQDLSKPYLAKITSQKNYTKFLQLVKGAEGPPTDLSPDSGINELTGLSPEEQEKQKEQWAKDLQKVEEEIHTLREVLSSKMKVAHELKRKLGFTVWREFEDDMIQGIRNVKESNIYQSVEETVEGLGKAIVEAPIYQKTESVLKATTEKTTSLLGGLGTGISSKFGQMRNSDSFRSFEEKLGSAYENVKTKVSSRSNSMQSFDEALRESEGRKLSSASTPTINEERPS